MSLHERNSCTIVQKFSNDNHEIDRKNTIRYTKWLLKILGIWPLVQKNSTTVDKYLCKGLIIICGLTLGFLIVPATLYMILREKDLYTKLILFGPIGYFFSSLLKYICIVLRTKTMKDCLEHVERDWMMIENETDRQIMTRNSKVSDSLTFMCGIFMYTGGMSYHVIIPLVSGKKINELNETVRPFAYPGYDIFIKSQSSPIYEMIFCTICAGAFVGCTITTVSCNLAALFVTHACGEIEIIMARLEGLVGGINDTKNSVNLMQDRISACVESHARVLRFSSDTEKLLREICLIEMVTSTFTICLLEYYCLTEWRNGRTATTITYFVLLISLSFNVYIFCHIGELLQAQSTEIGTATYMMEWYKLPRKTGLALVMVLAIANYPRRITAGGMMDLTIFSFGKIIKTSVVYLNLLRTVTE